MDPLFLASLVVAPALGDDGSRLSHADLQRKTQDPSHHGRRSTPQLSDVRQVQRLIENGEHLAAMRTATSALQHATRDARLYYLRGLANLELRDLDAALKDFESYLQLSPTDDDACYGRGLVLLKMSKLSEAASEFRRILSRDDSRIDARICLGIAECYRRRYPDAITQFSSVLRIDSRNKLALHWRGVALLRSGHSAKATADVARLLQLYPAQKGGYVAAATGAEDATRMAYADKQVQSLFADRPAMAKQLSDDAPIVKWLVEKFAGKNMQSGVVWSPLPPHHGFDADYQLPTQTRRAVIRVSRVHTRGPRKGQPLNSDELWNRVAFELFNIDNAPRIRPLVESTRRGEVSRSQFIRGLCELEFEALRRTRAFYLDTYLPWARTKGIETDPACWRLTLPLSFSEWIAQYRDESGYPWTVYGQYYDEWIAQYRREGRGSDRGEARDKESRNEKVSGA